MSQVAHRLSSLVGLTLTAALTVASLSGCSSNSVSNPTGTNPTPQTGAAFVVGTDAPLAGVVSFSVQLQSVDAVDANGNQVPLISGSPTVDFARFNGLQTLLDLNDVPVGTYTSINITLGPATIGYLSTQAGSAPTVQTENATLTTSTIQVPLSTPFVVSQSDPIGLHFDFDLHKSIQVDGNGQITGQVNPTFNLRAVDPSNSGAYIDEFDAAVISADPQGQTFQIQGPHGRQFTVNVNGQTEFDGGNLGALTSSSIVQVSGIIDRADSTIDADEVAILSQNGFYAAGQITYVQQPASGSATSFDLFVRGLLPTTTGLSLGQIAQVNLSGNENFYIYWMHNPITQYLFNASTLVPGQHVAVGGPASGATNPQAVTVNRVVLRHWGYNGTVVGGSVTSGGSFQMNVSGFAGQLVPGTVTVYTGALTQFRNGLTSVGDVSSASSIRVVGLLIRDQSSGQLVLLAHYVDELN